MKELVSFEQLLGGDGGKIQGKGGVEGTDITLQLSVKYPVEKVLEPAFKVIDQLVDKLEALIPGDQKAMAQSAKVDARNAVLKYISDSTSAPQVPAPAPTPETPAQG